jgi:cytochrome c55X
MVLTSWLLAHCAVAAEIDGERQEALRYLIRQDCGSCHGMTLKGGLGPALTPSALENKPMELLINSILFGRPGTPMPPWNSILTREETVWIVEQLTQGMPE